jgi:hypothetical protein
MANGSEIFAVDGQGNTLWSHDLNHQISSIAISSNGMYVAAGGFRTAPGPAGIFDNGEVYLFSSAGQQLWSVDAGSTNPVSKVAISADGSEVAADGEESIMYLSGSNGNTVWSYHTGGDAVGMDMSSDGGLVVASMGSIVALNNHGTVVWSHPGQALAVSVNSVAISSDGSRVWVGSAVDGHNGTLYLFSSQGRLLWQHQIYSPALSIQTGANTTALVTTNFGALLYGGDGSLLANMTSSAAAGTAGSCNPPPSFWYSSGNESPVAFIDTQGNVVTGYDSGGYIVNAALSSDGTYAAVVSNKGLNSTSSLAFVFLGQPIQGCVVSVSTTRVGGSAFYTDNVTSDISVGNPGYSYFLNGSVAFMGVEFATICPPIYAGCPIPAGGNMSSQQALYAGAIRLNVAFRDGTNETIGDVIGETYTVSLSQHTNPRAGILIVYTDSSPGYKSYLLVSTTETSATVGGIVTTTSSMAGAGFATVTVTTTLTTEASQATTTYAIPATNCTEMAPTVTTTTTTTITVGAASTTTTTVTTTSTSHTQTVTLTSCTYIEPTITSTVTTTTNP